MVEFIKELITTLFGNYVWIGIIILAMIPITELRVALPFAMSNAWGAKRLVWWQAYLCAVIGSTLPALVIVPLLLPVFAWMKKTKWFSKLANAFDKKFNGKSQNIDAKVKTEKDVKKAERIKFWGVVTFVAIPLPLTGAWTGSAVAAYLKMHWFKGVIAVFLGNLISGLIMLTFCLLFPNSTDLITYIFLGLVAVVLLAGLVLHFVKKNKNKDTESQENENNDTQKETTDTNVVIKAVFEESQKENNEEEQASVEERTESETTDKTESENQSADATE